MFDHPFLEVTEVDLCIIKIGRDRHHPKINILEDFKFNSTYNYSCYANDNTRT